MSSTAIAPEGRAIEERLTSANEAPIDVANLRARRLEELKAMGRAYVNDYDARLRRSTDGVRQVEQIEQELALRCQREEHEANEAITRELAEALRHLKVPILVVPANAFNGLISQDLLSNVLHATRTFQVGQVSVDGAHAAGVAAAPPLGAAY